MDFYKVLEETEEDQAYNPYAGKTSDGEWVEGTISISFLNEYFGHFETANEMINETESEGLKLYFSWLKDQGILK